MIMNEIAQYLKKHGESLDAVDVKEHGSRLLKSIETLKKARGLLARKKTIQKLRNFAIVL